MNGVALGLVLAAAFLHASWNFLAKKSQMTLMFIWWFLLVSALFYFPLFLYFWPRTTISPTGWICIAATSILHALYFWSLGEAYALGDLSLIYPLARGIGPLLVPVLAVGLIKEQLSAPGILGIGLIVIGIYVLHVSGFSKRTFFMPFRALRSGSSLWAITTGGTIALYSLVDKVGVSNVNPPVYVYLMFLGAWMLLTPYVLVKERRFLLAEWHRHRGAIVVVGFLVLFTYMLILFAMRLSKVSYVVALRETSILFSVFLGILWLHEKHGRQKFVGAALIFFGVFFISLSE
jgi:drug/metabolite transporter (DMT)-like permease